MTVVVPVAGMMNVVVAWNVVVVVVVRHEAAGVVVVVGRVVPLGVGVSAMIGAIRLLVAWVGSIPVSAASVIGAIRRVSIRPTMGVTHVDMNRAGAEVNALGLSRGCVCALN